MRRLAAPALVLVVGTSLCLVAALAVGAKDQGGRDTRLFRIDPKAGKVLGPASHVRNYLGLRLAGAAMDQPQYWPHEKVRVKVMMPGCARAQATLQVRKRDANPVTIGPIVLDENGLAVVEVMDGGKSRLQLGEYSVEVKVAEPPLGATASFAVVEGSLGSVSLAHEFKRLTNPADLERVKAGWFLGNAAGAGKRWGNGLSFKNELRVSNRPYDGPVTVTSRCMLPGCNGVQAGPPIQMTIQGGKLQGTVSVSGHSGPFQIEVVTPKGSLRHQFEGSSHVERDMVQISKGVRHRHAAGLAPYAGTTQVPGRQLFVESKLESEKDAFEVASPIAQGGKLSVGVRRGVTGAALHAWSPKPDGRGFELKVLRAGARLQAGSKLEVPVLAPYTMIAIGGWSGGKFVEGYTLAFPPAGMKVKLDAPKEGAPLREVPVAIEVSASDGQGQGLQVSGILEAYDNRIASRSPDSPLASAVGDSFRNVGNSLNAWVDQLELERRAKEEEARDERAPRKMVLAKPAPSPSMAPRGRTSSGVGGGYGVGYAKARSARYAIRLGGPAQGGTRAAQGGDEEVSGEIRKGEQKVVACERVQTDASGRATVKVKLPPQTGRVSFRFVALRGLDWASAERGLDVAKKAFVEVQLPQSFVPGARIEAKLSVVNTLKENVTLAIWGAGIAATQKHTIPPGQKELSVRWEGRQGGTLSIHLQDARGRSLDRRELALRDVANQTLTLSRLELGGKQPVSFEKGESAMVYEGPGALLKGMVTNVVTTTYSWFGHAEALSAKAAVHASLLAAIHRGILADEGLEQTLRVDLDKAVRDLKERFYDVQTGLVRPYPGLPPNPLWSAWAARNLHATLRTLRGEPKLLAKLKDAVASSQTMVAGIRGALKQRGLSAPNLAGFDPDQEGREVIPIELDGKVVYRVLTDDAVARFAADRLLPLIDPRQRQLELAFGRAYDRFRFLRAFKRTGALQYLAESAKALWLAGPKRRAQFNRIFGVVARGMILAQEPGLIQGPALTGGVYSTPMALVRFLELLLLTGKGSAAKGTIAVQGAGVQSVGYGQALAATGPTTLTAPEGAVVRIDRPHKLTLSESYGAPFASARLSKRELAIAERSSLEITLDASKDPLEYYAIIAVPSTVAVRQTEDILSDYKGQLLYGQQSMGAAKMQALAVPFRGSRSLKLWLEGAYSGVSDGLVAIRHMHNPQDVCTLKTGAVTVR